MGYEEELFTEEDRELIKKAYILGFRYGYNSNYDNVEEALKADFTDENIDQLLFENFIEIYIPNK